jgi:hypothetical protein
MSDVKQDLQYSNEAKLVCEQCKQMFLFDGTFKNCILYRCEECLRGNTLKNKYKPQKPNR